MRVLSILTCLFLLPACQTLHFYSQAVRGQAEISLKAKPSSRLIEDPGTPERLRRQLTLAKSLCDFASSHLDLPGHSSYHRYTDLNRKHVVWVMHATPTFSLEPKSWKYPVIGEIDYRGYFKESDATAYAEQLRAEGYDVHLGGTNAYSTLGFFHDPVLNTFVHYPEIDLAELIFHELTHRRLFRKNDTTFSESLANTVAEEGVKLWLLDQNRHQDHSNYLARLERRRQFYNEVSLTRNRLDRLYASGVPDSEKLRQKQILLKNLQSSFRELQRRWGTKALQSWLDQPLTNAHLAALATYHEDIPEFQKLLRDSNGDFKTFFHLAEQYIPKAPPP